MGFSLLKPKILQLSGNYLVYIHNSAEHSNHAVNLVCEDNILCTEDRENSNVLKLIFGKRSCHVLKPYTQNVCNLRIIISATILDALDEILVNLLMIHCCLEGIIEFLLESSLFLPL